MPAGALISVSSSELPVGDRFEWYTHLVRENIAPFSLSSALAHDFHGRVLAIDLSGVQIANFSFSSVQAVRTSRHIRREDPETYQLALVRGSPMWVNQRRNQATVGGGDLVFFDSSHPLEASVPHEYGLGLVTMLRMPKSAFPLAPGKADRLLSQRLSPHGVTGALLCQYLTTVCDRAADLSAVERYRLGTIAVDLAAAFLSDHLDAQYLLPVDTRQQTLLARINAFIDRHLGNPDLTPAYIAARHHISLRSLHLLFGQQPQTVSVTIRRRRLERCRTDLADPRLRGQPISTVAARWGFLVPAEFSRAFRAAYGLTPTEFRYQAAREQSLR
ncbi:helix-turn-helix domain-containing protein [Streptomyces coffeae]|uniref:Helix-turn-helix domain-containing protein n=1 Tax=Streptomyces coffeae TaxID=621382 RepID=A0ABS1NE22_9ACTN|nr:helix-turn-helix domain-containing protein [Streptomyces coffeae]MBL1098342.1 helix-turn-helix domain-containing protein [Streptomyces coffeae]